MRHLDFKKICKEGAFRDTEMSKKTTDTLMKEMWQTNARPDLKVH